MKIILSMLPLFSFVIANPLKRMKQSLFLSFQNITLSLLSRIRGINFKALARRMPGGSRLSFRAHARNLILSFLSSVIANPLKRMKQSLLLSFQNITLSFPSRIRGINIQPESNALSFPRKRESRILYLMFLLFFTLPSFAFAQEKIPVFPTTPVEAYTVYGSLALFWLVIIFLIVVIKMKLNEIERIQKMGIDEEDENAPVLE